VLGLSVHHQSAPAGRAGSVKPSVVTKAATTVAHAATAVGSAIVTGFTAQAPFGIGVAHGVSLPQPTLALIVFVAGIVSVQRRRRNRGVARENAGKPAGRLRMFSRPSWA
jgi:hypothetical protein